MEYSANTCECLFEQVQSKWSNLLSIFVGSADIRTQLPEESKRSVHVYLT